MNAWKTVLATLLTVATLLISHQISPDKPHPTIITARTGAITMTHTALLLHEGEEGSPLFSVRVQGIAHPDSITVFLMYRPAALRADDIGEPFVRLKMPLGDQAIDDYEAYLSRPPRGEKLLYYIEVADLSGNVLASLPKDAGDPSTLLQFQFRSTPPTWMEILRVSFSAAALLAANLAFLGALGLRERPGGIGFVGKAASWTALFLAGTVVSGILHTKTTVGGVGWGAWPIGEFDLVHTVTEIALLFWITLTVLLKGSAFTVANQGNVISVNTARVLAIAGYPLVLAMYLLPRNTV